MEDDIPQKKIIILSDEIPETDAIVRPAKDLKSAVRMANRTGLELKIDPIKLSREDYQALSYLKVPFELIGYPEINNTTLPIVLKTHDVLSEVRSRKIRKAHAEKKGTGVLGNPSVGDPDGKAQKEIQKSAYNRHLEELDFLKNWASEATETEISTAQDLQDLFEIAAETPRKKQKELGLVNRTQAARALTQWKNEQMKEDPFFEPKKIHSTQVGRLIDKYAEYGL